MSMDAAPHAGHLSSTFLRGKHARSMDAQSISSEDARSAQRSILCFTTPANCLTAWCPRKANVWSAIPISFSTQRVSACQRTSTARRWTNTVLA